MCPNEGLSVKENPAKDVDPRKGVMETIRKGCPASVLLAVDFVEMCVGSQHEQATEAIFIRNSMDDDDDQDTEPIEMHPKQQACFERACNLIGIYFDAEAARIKGE